MHVTEFINEIIAMISEIKECGFAYESNGSVYFDVRSMLVRSTHARLMPSRLQMIIDNASAIANDEFVEVNNDKRNPHDFALWKRTDIDDANSWRKFGAQPDRPPRFELATFFRCTNLIRLVSFSVSVRQRATRLAY